ncbi:MAG: NAD-glutamate dehydrogenase [bacterium]|nr:MAG: NAD-glutamate dehydrogenase [bacterium]
MPEKTANRLFEDIRLIINENHQRSEKNMGWLARNMHPYFFITMKEETGALATLACQMQNLKTSRQLILADRENVLILARQDTPGSLYETLSTLQERDISYIEIIHSENAPPGLKNCMEIQTYKFERKDNQEISRSGKVFIPEAIRTGVREELAANYPDFDMDRLDAYLRILWLNNENYVRISPYQRIAQTLDLYYQGNRHGGVFFDVEDTDWPGFPGEYRVRFAAGNPPQRGFLQQLMEAFHRLDIGIRRTYCLMISTGIHPYFLGTFYARFRKSTAPLPGTALFAALRSELENSQILATESFTYTDFVMTKYLHGEDAALVNAFVSFCHTNLAHSSPAIYELETVIRAFTSHPEIMLKLVNLFRIRFDPQTPERADRYSLALQDTERAVTRYNTGHRYQDELYRTIFRCCIAFVKHTLKTNFFVNGKQALAFRLDPAYLGELDHSFTADLPDDRPFRVTFFFGRYGAGYHIGFSDIARGGWRTILAREKHDYALSADSLFKEVYVLAHTQHLKNKDIYEGGSKMAVVVDVEGITDENLVTQRMYKLQYGFINAFLDLFITEDGRAKDPAVVDYYGEDEPIELGPDENMHDEMIEEIARLSLKRGYVLGSGIISSKRIGISHKEYGVTSTGVVTFAQITMKALGKDIRKDPFTVKLTGGPDGDVAGNAIRLLIERCPKVKINLILDGSGVLYDPAGANRSELKRILFKGNIDSFRPSKLHKGGFILYRTRQKEERLAKRFKRVSHNGRTLEEKWVSLDDFYQAYEDLIFTTPSDLFIPAGGRPETIDETNYQKFMEADGTPTARAIVEGANSFITPGARDLLQERGVVIMRDASANKCGVISSSYEVIANLLMSDEEFLAEKDRYVSDVLEILEKRAADEARLILARHRESEGNRFFTDISDDISREINAHYGRLFDLLRRNPELTEDPLLRKALLAHLPRLIRESRKYRARIEEIPAKYRYAILASEIASSLVYKSNRETDFVDQIRGHLRRVFTSKRMAGDPKFEV